MILQKTQSFINRHRRGVIVAFIAIVLLVVAGIYALWSANIWSTQKTTYESWQSTLRKDVDTALALPATTHAERSGKMSALKNVSNNIVSAKKSLCSVSSLVSWQQFLTPLKAQKEACDHIIKTADAFGDKIQATVSYIENEQALMKIITASTGSQDKITEAVWDTQTTTWQGATDSLKKLSVQTSFAPVKDSAITDAQAIEAAWQGLIAAHKAKDKTKYLEAQAQLAQAYGALGAIAAQSTQQFLSVANSLQTAYKDAFSSSMV